MIDLIHLQTLAAILRLGSFEGAAADLGVTQSAVSQRIRALEDRVGQPLVLRGTPCRGTDAGLQLARLGDDIGVMQGQTLAALGLADAGPQPVRIAVNADSLAAWLIPALAAAQAGGAGLMFDVVVDDQDHSADWLRRGEVSGAITATETPPAGCDSIALGRLRYVATASPAFVARHCPDGVTGPALRAAPMMVYDRKDRLQHLWLDQAFGPGPAPRAHYLPSTHAFIDAAMAGLGWGMNPAPLVSAALADRRLVTLRPDAPLDTPLYWQVTRRMAPALAGLTRALRETARRQLH